MGQMGVAPTTYTIYIGTCLKIHGPTFCSRGL